jgi:hypothetical protein
VAGAQGTGEQSPALAAVAVPFKIIEISIKKYPS